MSGSDETITQAVDALIDANRTRCLWFMRSGYYPRSPDGQLRALDHIIRHGDREAAQRATSLRRCLSQRSSGESAAS